MSLKSYWAPSPTLVAAGPAILEIPDGTLLVLDALLLVWVTDWAAVAFHGLALFFIVRGFQAARRQAALRTAAALPAGMVPPITPR